ncbi:MAG: response regulator [Desulfobacterota bacterium]|nr:response regulator [Thermodesulfobacteriota bacterium]
MSAITIFSGSFCKEEQVCREVQTKTGAPLFSDKEVVDEASRLSGIPEARLDRAFSARTSVFNKFTHEKERSIAYLKLAVAGLLSGDPLSISGFSGLLIPNEVSHVLRVCLIADMRFRTSLLTVEQGIPEKEASKVIHKQDEDRALWVNSLFQRTDPWDSTLYDIVLPMDKTEVGQAADLIARSAESTILQPTVVSKRAVDDFVLASKVEIALLEEGHHVAVAAKGGQVSLTVNKHVLMLSRLEEELKGIAGKIDGVKGVETRVGKGFYQTDVYRKFDFELPSKVLLVDDEREFVQTLSERLLMRDMGSAVAYDGESALNMIAEDEPEVMILDLKMPGIDGIEVLRRVKESRSEIEVIILTGHGSEADRETCMNLGAFAYLQKPVNIEVLSETLKRANEKVQQAKQRRKAR